MHNIRVARWIASVRVPRRPFAALAFVLLASLQVAGHHRGSGWRQDVDTSSGIDVDFARPDVLIRTRSLSSFFRDLLKVPIAHDLFGEDLAFYYEMSPGRLGLAGTIRRISYEHNLTWTDRIVSSAFDEPADVLLWRGPKGSLDYWAIAMSRGAMATMIQEAATIAHDTQLKPVGEISVDGAAVPAYALVLDDDRTLLLASYHDRVVVLSDADMLRGSSASGDVRTAVGRLLSADVQQRTVFDTAFPAGPTRQSGEAPVHSVAARLHYASFGYQGFFPGVEALKFDFGGGAWSTSLLMDPAQIPGGALGERAPWTAVPANAAFCAMLPVDWSQGRSILARVGNSAEITDLSQELEGPAVVCWYEDGRIHTPLIAATLKTPRPELEPLVTTLFDWSIKRGKATAPPSIARPAADEALWQRELEVPYSAVDEATGRPEPGNLTITLGIKGRRIFFSPDADQVTRALATAAKRYPSMADVLPRDGTTLGVIVPKTLASLARKEALVMLPAPDEPVFRAAAERHLMPRLDRLATYPAYRLTVPTQTASGSNPGRGWQQVAWQELAR